MSGAKKVSSKIRPRLAAAAFYMSLAGTLVGAAEAGELPLSRGDPGAAPADGFETRPAGPPQHPNLLRGYAARPPWRVVGVDYAAGVAAGQQLRDPLSVSGPGIFIAEDVRLIRIHGDNVILDGYDFSLHGGFAVYITGANAEIRNSNFALGSSAATYLVLDQSPLGGLKVVNCTMDGSTLGNLTSFIGYSSPGALLLEHNHFKNFPQHVLELVQGPGARFSVLYRYNLIENGALQKGAHLNYIQFSSGDAEKVEVVYNTSLQRQEISSGEGYQFYDGAAGGSISNITVSYNTMIAAGAPGRKSMSFLFHGPGKQRWKGTACCNHIDAAAAYGVFYPNSFEGWAIYKNIDMRSGRELPPNR
jgi:hypothetical protein